MFALPQNIKTKLLHLIAESQSLSNEEKESLAFQLPKLDTKRLARVIAVLEKEKHDRLLLRKEKMSLNEKYQAKIANFIRKIGRMFLTKKERSVSSRDKQELRFMDDILSNL